MTTPIEFKPGTLGHLLRSQHGGFLVGLSAARDGAELVIERVTFELESRFGSVEITIRRNGRVRVLPPTRWDSEGEYPFHPDAAARVADVVATYCTADDEALDGELPYALLAALFPTRKPGTYAAWLATHGHAFATAGDPVVCRVPFGEGTVELSISGIEIDAGIPRLRALTALVQRDGTGAIVEQREQELYWGAVHPDAFDRSAEPLGGPRFIALAAAWRAHVAGVLQAGLARDSEFVMMPMDLPDEVSRLFDVVQVWLIDGLPPPPPRLLSASQDQLAGQVTRIRQLTDDELEAVAASYPDIKIGYTVDGYDVLLGMGTDDDIGDDRVLVRRHGSEPFVILCSDTEPQNRLKYTVDGDAPTMRAVLAWLRTLVQRAELDVEIAMPHPFDEDIVTRVTTWLQLSARENPFDWRMSWDALVDRAPYWDSKDVFLPPPPEAEVARIREHDIPAYHQFVRDVIDAGFQPTA